MHVVSLALAPNDHGALVEACEKTGLTLHHLDPPAPEISQLDIVLAVFYNFTGSVIEPSPREMRGQGAYPIAVLPSSTSGGLAALEQGYSLVLATPLRVGRLAQCLGYLRDLAPPPASQALVLDAAGRVSSLSGSVMLTPAESRVLGRLGHRDGRIVRREELSQAAGEDLTLTIVGLKLKLREIESAVKILAVPRLGYRLVGSLRDASASPGPDSE